MDVTANTVPTSLRSSIGFVSMGGVVNAIHQRSDGTSCPIPAISVWAWLLQVPLALNFFLEKMKGETAKLAGFVAVYRR